MGREKKGQAVFSTAWAFARCRGGRAKLERKDFTGGPAKRVRRGGLEWKGCTTSAGSRA